MKKIKLNVKSPRIKNRAKFLIIKSTIGLITAAVIGTIVKEELKVLDDLEEKLFPDETDDAGDPTEITS